jgi:pimeloyl-ACP methyl ester carboxylesterase
VNLDDEQFSRTLFHPRKEDWGYSPAGVITETQCSGASVCGYLHKCHSSDTLLLFFHGNGEVAADYDALSSIYTDCGASFWAVDYRGYGRSTGMPSFSRMLKDAEAIFDDIPRVSRVSGIQFYRVIVMGRSLGSASAIHLAAIRTGKIHGLILDSPYAHGPALIERLGGPRIPANAIKGFQDNIDLMCKCTMPTLIIHGTQDFIIQIEEAVALQEACPSQTKRLVKISGAGHNDLLSVGFRQYCESLKKHIQLITKGA